MSSNQKKHFFCDMALADVNAIACAANRFLCHGSTHATLGKGKVKPVDLTYIDVIAVSLDHISSTPLNDDYYYHLIYIGDEVYNRIWKGSEASNGFPLSKLCIRREHTPHAAPARTKKSLLENKARDYVVGDYDLLNGLDHYVGFEYRLHLASNYQAYIVRSTFSSKGILQNLIDHNLRTVHESVIENKDDGEMHISTFRRIPNVINTEAGKRNFFEKLKTMTTRLKITH